MGKLLVLVSPCFRENVVVRLCSLDIDNLLQKNVIVFFFGNQISKWRSFEEKKGYFWPTFHNFLVTREKLQIFFKGHISLTYTHVLCSPYWSFYFALPILKKIRIYQAWFLFGMIPGVDSYSRHFGTINK